MATPLGGAVFDWQKCVFCQKVIRNEKTTCPADSKRADAGVTYETVAEVINGFVQLGQLPERLLPFVACWNDGDGVQETFTRHRALWHIKCKQRLVHGTKLERLHSVTADSKATVGADVGLSDECEVVSSPKLPRMTRGTSRATTTVPTSSTLIDSVCLFCDAGGTDLRQVLTFAVDGKVRRCATILADSMLLGKLAKGDMIAIGAKYHPSCLLSLYYKATQAERQQNLVSPDDDGDAITYTSDHDSLALAEVVSYMEDFNSSGMAPAVF